MAEGVIALLVGLLVLVWGGGTVVNDRWLAWSRNNIKYVALGNVIIGAFIVYLAITQML